MTPSAALLGVPLAGHAMVLYCTMDIAPPGWFMALLTAAGTFGAAMVLGVRHWRRWEPIIPAAVWMPLAMSWFDVYRAMDMYSPHAAAYSFAARHGFPSRTGIIAYALWLILAAFLGWKAAGQTTARV